jgi:outer membrane protein assembly factor BamB
MPSGPWIVRATGGWKGVGLAMLAVAAASAAARGDDWPQWRGPQRDGVWRETGIVATLPAGQLPIRWRAEVGSGYCGPTVAGGRVYVMDRVAQPESTERIHCFDAASGQKLWSHAYACPYGEIGYPAGPRAAVTIAQGRAFALGATGRLHVLDAATGQVRWHRDLAADYAIQMPIWGIAAAPLVHEGRVILHIGGKDACVVALRVEDGREAWRALSDRAQYSAPIVVEQAGRQVVVCWTGDSVAGLAPEDGSVLWRYVWTPRNMPIGIATPVREGDRLFFTSFYDGSLMLRLLADRPEVEKVWQIAGRDEKNTLALHSIISTPVLDRGFIYGVDSYGELRCLDAATGQRLWEDQRAVPRERWSTIHFVKHQDRYVLFNERGELIFARLAPQGYQELSRARLIEPTRDQLPSRRGGVCWAHPAFADRHVFARNDQELVCASLAAP